MEKIQEATLYKSHDFYISAICLAAGLQLINLERGNGKFAVFVFSDPLDKSSQIISDHWNGVLKLSSRNIIEAINELKTRLYSQSDG